MMKCLKGEEEIGQEAMLEGVHGCEICARVCVCMREKVRETDSATS